MKKKFLSLILALAVCLGLAAPAAAYTPARAGERSTIAPSGAVDPDGTLWMWGGNTDGQVGNGIYGTHHHYTTDRYEIIPVPIMADVKSVCTIGNSSAAIKNDGSLWTWGHSDAGQLGNDGGGNVHLEYETSTESYNYYLQTVPAKVMDDVAAVSLGTRYGAIGGGFGAAIKTDGSLWMWGDNGSGQLEKAPLML